jgi:hypothetical protein
MADIDERDAGIDECYICTGAPEECGCEAEDEYCSSCGGSGWRIPVHCCNCGGGEYDCICCQRCGEQNIGRCPCTISVPLQDGGTIELPGVPATGGGP